jgi:hypothetical protein
MSGNWENGAQPPLGPFGLPAGPLGQPPMTPDPPTSGAFLVAGGSVPPSQVDWSLVGQSESPKPSRSFGRRIVVIAVAMSVVGAFAVVASVNSKASGVHAALASAFSSPTLKVVLSGHSTNPQEEATVSKYAVGLTVTSENGRQPLSGADGVDDYEVSVLRGGVDLCDVIVADHAVYVRVNLRAIDPSSYESEVRSALRNVPVGSAHGLALDFLQDRWVGIDDSTIESFAKSVGVSATQRKSKVNLDSLRNAFTLSFAQSWDAWASIHELSSGNDVTEYSVKLPVQHFVATFVKDIEGAILKALPAAEVVPARSALSSASSAIDHIPAGLEIPITLTVSNGSLTGLAITYKGDSVDLAISHPTVGVTAPSGADMVTNSMLRSLLGDYDVCPPAVASAGGTSSTSGLGLQSSCLPSGIATTRVARLPGSSSSSAGISSISAAPAAPAAPGDAGAQRTPAAPSNAGGSGSSR